MFGSPLNLIQMQQTGRMGEKPGRVRFNGGQGRGVIQRERQGVFRGQNTLSEGGFADLTRSDKEEGRER